MLNETIEWTAMSYAVINSQIYASLEEEESADVSILVCQDLS